jgi:hypothetical protein
MSTRTARAAADRAWETYLMINRGADVSDARRAALELFLDERYAAGNLDGEGLAVEGLQFLRRQE